MLKYSHHSLLCETSSLLVSRALLVLENSLGLGLKVCIEAIGHDELVECLPFSEFLIAPAQHSPEVETLLFRLMQRAVISCNFMSASALP